MIFQRRKGTCWITCIYQNSLLNFEFLREQSCSLVHISLESTKIFSIQGRHPAPTVAHHLSLASWAFAFHCKGMTAQSLSHLQSLRSRTWIIPTFSLSDGCQMVKGCEKVQLTVRGGPTSQTAQGICLHGMCLHGSRLQVQLRGSVALGNTANDTAGWEAAKSMGT